MCCDNKKKVATIAKITSVRARLFAAAPKVIAAAAEIFDAIAKHSLLKQTICFCCKIVCYPLISTQINYFNEILVAPMNLLSPPKSLTRPLPQTSSTSKIAPSPAAPFLLLAPSCVPNLLFHISSVSIRGPPSLVRVCVTHPYSTVCYVRRESKGALWRELEVYFPLARSRVPLRIGAIRPPPALPAQSLRTAQRRNQHRAT